MSDKNSYDTGVSAQVQSAINALSGQITALIEQHRGNVDKASAQAKIDGAMDTYLAKEAKFNTAADATLGAIKAVQDTMAKNDNTARDAMKKAQAAADSIGG
ncbi:hypothetical protein OG474_40380 [Kribbella sp. NBC_01505]|uniref:hypothetical protein n=1 Tax=Kribbella sp. NBC_01505 TaxID=2903580 RepID=UPI0038669FB6